MFTEDDVKFYLAELALALHHLHNIGIIYRLEHFTFYINCLNIGTYYLGIHKIKHLCNFKIRQAFIFFKLF